MILYKRRFLLLVVSFFLTFSNLFGQDLHFSQFYANPVYLNPAFSGTAICPRFTLNFRDQWPAFPKNFISFSGSYDQNIPDFHGGVALLATGDIAFGGIWQSYSAGAIYNFRAQVAPQCYLQFALQGNYLFHSVNWTNLLLASDILNSNALPDFPEDQNAHLTKSQFDVSFGMMSYTPYLYFGLAVHHLLPLQPDFLRNTNNKLERIWEPKWTAHIGGKITLAQKIKSEVNFGDVFLYPNLIFISQGKFHYLHEGFYFNLYPLTIGAWLRHNFKNFDAFIISCGVEYKFFKIGYSYDFNLNKLEGSGGSHEVSLQFIIPCNTDKMGQPKNQSRKYSPIACPNF